ncbi:MAG: hypothetical protein K2L39_02875 [Muribaculaceae bacterium]|nr:hypothetical protein [Muribaculaceae bacterium]
MPYRLKKVVDRLSLASALLFLPTLLTGCESEGPELIPVAGQTPQAPSEVSRAVLVYMLSDNSLGKNGYDRDNLADMIEAARDGRLGGNRLLIYHDDSDAECPALKEVTPLGLKILKYYDNSQTSVSSGRMEQAIADFKSYAPAERYGLVVWSHATGWLQTGTTEPLGGATPMWVGEDKGKYMNVTTLARVLDGKGFDYIYFDCCHMASVEALYELRNTAGKFVGSCAELPAAGMPYYDALPSLMPYDADLEGAAAATFSMYDAMEGINRTATMSVIDASGLERLAEATRAIYSLHPQLPRDYKGQEFERPKYGGVPCYMFDFGHYINALFLSSGGKEMTAAYAEWLTALDECVTYEAATPWVFNTIKIDNHCGLSTYILRREADADVNGYRQLAWYTDVASALFDSDDEQ